MNILRISAFAKRIDRPRLWHYLVVLAVVFWLGGLSFYALIVVPVGTDVLGSTGQGFITQRVTNQLNLTSSAILVLLFANAIIRRGRLLIGSLVVVAAAQLVLILMHRWLDAMLDAKTQEISDGALFYTRHGLYLDVTAVQWGGLLAHLWCILSQNDGGARHQGG